MKRILVLGLVPPYVELFRPVAERNSWELIPVLHEDEFDGAAGYPVEEMTKLVESQKDQIGPIDALVAYRDFPECTLVADLARIFGVRGPTLESVLKCEHKYWSRAEQSKVVGAHIPEFHLFDVFADPVRPALEPPYWVKPVKSFASHLGFRIEGDEDLTRAAKGIRKDIRRLSDPLAYFMRRADGVPKELDSFGTGACLAESLIGGHQCTVEGVVSNGEVTIVGVVDSIRKEGSTVFLRYQYPSALPSGVQDEMVDLTRKLIAQIEMDHSAFNVEFFWDEEKQHIWLLEINNRIAPHHAPMFEAVDGRSNFEMAVQAALGEPVSSRGATKHAMAACCFLRRFEDATVTRAPSQAQVVALEKELDTMIELRVSKGKRLSEMREQDSYSFIAGLVYVSGANEPDILKKFAEIERRLDIAYAPTETGQ